ncbi:hypothetical protein F5B19DRAFT_492347 [Rostrohypoxylon terebratum]|nr:hypothetical protein F5B19DRAFT_492347 [Rostrohypoxylon terebratum]
MSSSVHQVSPLERMPGGSQEYHLPIHRLVSNQPTKIATRVLFNRLDEHNLTSRVLAKTPSTPDEDVCPPLPFGSIASINDLHDTVTRIAWAYAVRVVLPSFNRNLGQVPFIAKSELGRIMRAVYNLEMYFTCCRVQMMRELPADEEYISTGILPNLDHLLRKFSPWNVEQMVGVWEYLMLIAIPERKRDPEGMRWEFDGQLNAIASETPFERPDSFTSMDHPEMLLCQGLQGWEYYVCPNIDIKERRRAWKSWPRPHDNRIFRALYRHCETRFRDHEPITDLTMYGDHSNVLVKDIKDMKYWAIHFQPLFYSSDLDEGQFEVWKESYSFEVPQRAVYNFKHRLQWFHRSHGMYFWDKKRIDFVEAAVEDAIKEKIIRVPTMALWQFG